MNIFDSDFRSVGDKKVLRNTCMMNGKDFAFILWRVMSTRLVDGRCYHPRTTQYMCVNLTKMPDLSIIRTITPPVYVVIIEDNNISTIPADAFINATRGWFSYVNIYDNKIRYINPKAFRGLKVVSLRIRGNLFSNIEEGTFSYMWKDFRTLKLHHNKLSAINKGTFKGLAFRLKGNIILSYNNIGHIECESFLNIGNLTVLQLQNNRLVSLEKGMFLGLSILEELHLQNNKIRHVENGTFEMLKKLTELYLQNNSIEYIRIRGLLSIECLDLSNNNLHILQQGMFDNLPALEDLNLSKNKISNINITFFKNIKKIGKLSLQGNKLTYFNIDSFKEMPKIETLDITNNKIDTIENEAFTHVMPRYFILHVNGSDPQHLSWKTFTGEFPPYLTRRFDIKYFGKLKCVRHLCWMKQVNPKQITVHGSQRKGSRVIRREKEPLNECYLSLDCPSTDLCGLNQTQCQDKCSSHEREYVLSYEDHLCPYQQFCNCTCPEFNLTNCEANCARRNRGPVVGAKNKGNCSICDCSCPMFNFMTCEQNCAGEEKLPISKVNRKGCYSCSCQCSVTNCSSICPGHSYLPKTNKFGCEECHCLCPDDDCDALCNGPGLGVVEKDEAGCRVCKGCRNPSAIAECIDCELQCNALDLQYPVTENNTILFIKSKNGTTMLNATSLKEGNQNGNQTKYTESETNDTCYRSCADCSPGLHGNPSENIAAIVIPVTVLSLIMTVMVCVVLRKVNPCTREEEDLVLDFGFQGDIKLVLLINNLDLELGEEIKKCWIKPGTFCIGRLLGHGNFGTVWSGILNISKTKDQKEKTENKKASVKDNEVDVREEMSIAIKKIKGKRNPASVEEFLREAIVMRMLDHPHVLSLIGVSVHEDKPCVLLPFMCNGDLKSYVTRNESDLMLKDLLIFAIGIAEGMVYISDQKFVHRDLAARNCMLDSDLVVKVADFGLTRDVYEKDYYRLEDRSKGLPIRWMSLEAIQEGRFTTYSDVWSFGVLLWELFTFGAEPYPGLGNIEVEQYLLQNHRLRKPVLAPDLIYEIMCSCWNTMSQNRPTFTAILSRLNNYADTKADYLEMTNGPEEPKGISRGEVKDLDDGYLHPVNSVSSKEYENFEVHCLDFNKENVSEAGESLSYTVQSNDEYVDLQ